MAQDYAKKTTRAKTPNSRRQPSRSGLPGWLYLLAGLSIGIGIMAAKDYWQPSQPTEKEPKISTVEQPENRHKPRFDFYTLLRESEIIVPDDEPTVGREMAQSNDPYVYILQTGSFKNAGDADSLRAQLLLLNLNARVEDVEIHSGEKWHRVLVGPLENRSALADARSKLADNGIDSLLLKRKK